MVDDVITDGLTNIESVAMIRELCGVKFSGVLVALDRKEKNSLVRAEALQFGEFTLKSGRSSPYFFNSSKFNTGPLIEELGRYYASAIEENAPNCNLIFGPAYKGIPLCVSAATALSNSLNQNIGYFFNRKEKKTHGDQGRLLVNCRWRRIRWLWLMM